MSVKVNSPSSRATRSRRGPPFPAPHPRPAGPSGRTGRVPDWWGRGVDRPRTAPLPPRGPARGRKRSRGLRVPPSATDDRSAAAAGWPKRGVFRSIGDYTGNTRVRTRRKGDLEETRPDRARATAEFTVEEVHRWGLVGLDSIGEVQR